MRLAIAAFAAFATLAGCESTDLMSFGPMGRPDPLSVDPAALVVHVELPAGVEVAGPLGLRLEAVRLDTGEMRRARYLLVRRGSDWALSAAAASEMRQALAEVQAWRGAGLRGSESLSLAAALCRSGRSGGGVSADLSLDRGASFAPFLRGATLEEITGFETLPACR